MDVKARLDKAHKRLAKLESNLRMYKDFLEAHEFRCETCNAKIQGDIFLPKKDV